MPQREVLQTGSQFETDFRLIREARHLTIDQVHRRTMLQPETLEAFEDTGLLNNPVFANNTYRRAFVKNYAQAVGVTPEDALRSLDEAIAGTYQGWLVRKYLYGEPAPTEAPAPQEPPPEAEIEPQADWGDALLSNSMTEEAPAEVHTTPAWTEPDPPAWPETELEPVAPFDPEATAPLFEPQEPAIEQPEQVPADASPYAPPQIQPETAHYSDVSNVEVVSEQDLQATYEPIEEPAPQPRYYEPPALEPTVEMEVPDIKTPLAGSQGRHFEPPPLEGLARRQTARKRSWQMGGLALTVVALLALMVVAWLYWYQPSAQRGPAADELPLVGVSPEDLPNRFSGFIRPTVGDEQFVSLRIRSTQAAEGTFAYTLWTVDAGKMFSQEGMAEFNEARDRIRLSAEHGWGEIFKARDGSFILRSLGDNAASQWELKGG